MLKYSVSLYRTLELDGAPGYFEVGSLRLASSPDRMEELRRHHQSASRNGLETHLLSSREAQERFLLMETTDVYGALLVPSDGSAHAVTLAAAMRREAEGAGIKMLPNVPVTGIEVSNGRVRSVETSLGRIATRVVVAASGIWSPRIGKMAGVSIPLQPMQHQVV